MMGLPDGWVTDVGISRTAQLRALGNGVVPQQAAAALKTLLMEADASQVRTRERQQVQPRIKLTTEDA